MGHGNGLETEVLEGLAGGVGSRRVLQAVIMSAPCLVAVDGGSPEEVLKAACTPLWLSGYYVSGEPMHSFHEVPGRDTLVMVHAGARLKLVKPGIGYNRLH